LHRFLNSAFENFRLVAARWPEVDSFSGVLLLTESQNVNWFQSVSSYADQEHLIESGIDPHCWVFNRTNESCSLWARCTSGKELCIVAGRQIVTAEKLEVLALATDKEYVDGLPLAQTIETVKEDDAIAVVPWGFGKWMGKRGHILTEVLQRADKTDFFLGDNGGRTVFLRYPYHFRLAESKGMRILPGSDPLPFASECRRPGSFGFTIRASITSAEPAKEIKRTLLDHSIKLRSYGALQSPYRFFCNQLSMQIKKQLRQGRKVNS
jgi:hypothetical protein